MHTDTQKSNDTISNKKKVGRKPKCDIVPAIGFESKTKFRKKLSAASFLKSKAGYVALKLLYDKTPEHILATLDIPTIQFEDDTFTLDLEFSGNQLNNLFNYTYKLTERKIKPIETEDKSGTASADKTKKTTSAFIESNGFRNIMFDGMKINSLYMESHDTINKAISFNNVNIRIPAFAPASNDALTKWWESGCPMLASLQSKDKREYNSIGYMMRTFANSSSIEADNLSIGDTSNSNNGSIQFVSLDTFFFTRFAPLIAYTGNIQMSANYINGQTNDLSQRIIAYPDITNVEEFIDSYKAYVDSVNAQAMKWESDIANGMKYVVKFNRAMYVDQFYIDCKIPVINTELNRIGGYDGMLVYTYTTGQYGYAISSVQYIFIGDMKSRLLKRIQNALAERNVYKKNEGVTKFIDSALSELFEQALYNCVIGKFTFMNYIHIGIDNAYAIVKDKQKLKSYGDLANSNGTNIPFASIFERALEVCYEIITTVEPNKEDKESIMTINAMKDSISKVLTMRTMLGRMVTSHLDDVAIRHGGSDKQKKINTARESLLYSLIGHGKHNMKKYIYETFFDIVARGNINNNDSPEMYELIDAMTDAELHGAIHAALRFSNWKPVESK